jgi:hypothetical protein
MIALAATAQGSFSHSGGVLIVTRAKILVRWGSRCVGDEDGAWVSGVEKAGLKPDASA